MDFHRFNCSILVLVTGLFFMGSDVDHVFGRTVGQGDPSRENISGDSIRHDIGLLQNFVTNWGLLGGKFYGSPAGRWPGDEGSDLLYGAGIWIAGKTSGGDTRVSTGWPGYEIQSTEAPQDTVYALHWGQWSAHRYPLPLADDDGDGLEDEDPPNGWDDDNDGFLDEDGAGVGDQHFRCEMNDEVSNNRLHFPMGLKIVQDSFQWGQGDCDDFIGYSFAIENQGTSAIEDLYLGIYSDFDLENSEDDRADSFIGRAASSFGDSVDVNLGYMYQEDSTGYIGFMILDHPVDPTGQVAPAEKGISSFQIFNGYSSFEQGGVPTNDIDRYQAMSCGWIDGSPFGTSEYSILVSTGSFSTLDPGESLFLDAALVAGGDLEELLTNAANAAVVHKGRFFDRDGDPSTGPDGKEFNVKWLGPDEQLNNCYALGTVFNASDNNSPVPGAVVSILGTEKSALTNEEGRFFLSAPPGVYSLLAEVESLGSEYRSGVTFQLDQVQTEDFLIVDATGPFFLNTTDFPNTEDTVGPYVLEAEVYDISGVSGVSFYYTSSTAGGPFLVPMEETESGGGVYRGEIPGQTEGSLIQYWFVGIDELGNSGSSPSTAPFELNSFQIGTQFLAIQEDFETDSGWAVDNSQGTATNGFWERVDPNIVELNGLEIQPEDDHTPPPGVMCFITGNDPPGSPAGTNDVDGGATILLSPWMDVSTIEDPFVSYYRWFNGAYSPLDDLWQVEVTNDGLTWVLLESIVSSNRQWAAQSFMLDEFLSVGPQVRFRFIAEDGGTDSLVEAGLDDFVLGGLSRIVDLEGPEVSLLSPVGGELVTDGFEVEWSATDDTGIVYAVISLSTDGGESFPEVLFSGQANNSWIWQGPTFSSNHCRLKIVVFDSQGNFQEDESPADFSLNGPQSNVNIPSTLRLSQNVPNPFNPKTTIYFSLPSREHVELKIYDVRGQCVRSLISTTMIEGYHEIDWDGADKNGRTVAAGNYFYRLETSGGSMTRKMILLK